MGETSSKSLRSGAMDDIIFNGTQNLAAKNFAEVSIELDDFHETFQNIPTNEKKVIISRTLERGVGSFYKINNMFKSKSKNFSKSLFFNEINLF